MIPIVTAQSFRAEVLQSQSSVLVYFWAPWCGPCRLLAPLLEQLHSISGDAYRIVSVNADENFTLSNRYRLTTLPTLIWFENGHIRDRLEGVSDRETLLRFLDRHPAIANAV